MAVSFTQGNDFIVPTEDGQTYLGGAGNDTYMLSSATVAAGATIVIQDTEGTNKIQLVDGLEIASSTVYNNALELTLSNGAVIQIVGASNFGYDVGGNALFGTEGTQQTFTELVENTLGTTVPAEGEDPTTGGEVIIDIDPEPEAPTFTVTAEDVEEGGMATFTITLSEAQAEATTVDYAVSLEGGASAADHGDITVDSMIDNTGSGTLTFAAGETTKVITIPVTEDGLSPEEGEGITVTLSNPTGADAELGEAAAATAGIIDVPVTFELTQDADSVQEGSTVVYTVTASQAVAEDTTVVFNVAPGDATAADQGTNDTNLNDFAQSTFNPQEVVMKAGETTASFSLNTTDDGKTELPETFSVSASIGGEEVGNVETTLLDGAQAGQTFTLTTGIDNFTGTAQDDTFNGLNTTLTNLDNLDGAGGTGDTLNVNDTTGGTAFNTAVTIKNIENANLASAGTLAAVDTSSWSGLTNLTTTAVGAQTGVTAAGTTNVTSTITAQAAGAVLVTGGKDVSITATGTTTGTTTATGAAGNVNINSTGNYTNAGGAGADDVTLGAIAVTGGTSVNVTQSAGLTDAEKTAALTATTNDTVTQSAVTVTGGASTTDVTVVQDAAVTVAQYTAGPPVVDGKIGITNGAVTINDANAGSATAAGTIAEVTLHNYGNSTIDSSALTTVNLMGTGGTLGIGRGALTATPTANTLALNVMGGTMGAITDNEAAADDGFTTINIAGSTADTKIAGLTAADMTKLNVSGDQKVTLTALTAAGLTDITSTNTEGTVISSTLNTGTVFTGGEGADSIKIGASTADSTLGGGNDRLIVTSAIGNGGTVDAGTGSDILEVNGNVTQAAVFNAATIAALTNFDSLAISGNTGGNTFTFNPSTGLPAGLSTSVLELGANTNLTVNGLTKGAVVTVNGTQTTGVTLGTDATGGGSDTLTINVDASAGAIALNKVTAANIDTLNVDVASNSAGTNGVTISDLSANTDLETLNLSGNGPFSVTTAAAVVDTINSTTTGAVTYVATANTTAATYTGGSGVDTVTASAHGDTIFGNGGNDVLTGAAGTDGLHGGDGNDTIVGGAGNDTISGGEGINTITGGADVDTIDVTQTTQAVDTISLSGFIASVDRDIITGFHAGTGGDILQVAALNTAAVTPASAPPVFTDDTTSAATGGGVYALTGASTSASDIIVLQAGADLTSGTNGGDLSLTTAAGLNGTELLKALTNSAAADTYTQITTSVAGDTGFMLAYQGGNAYLYHFAAGVDSAIVASEIQLIGTLSGVAADSLVQGNFDLV
jgi:S-layer protein